MNRFLPILLGSLLLAHAALGQDAEMSAEKRADIMRLMELTDVEQIRTSLSRQFMGALVGPSDDPAAPEERRVEALVSRVMQEEMAAALPSLLDQIAPLYAEHFTHDEIRGLIDFYSTPLGRKTVEAMPELMQQSSELGMRWGQRVAPRIMQRLQEEIIRLRTR